MLTRRDLIDKYIEFFVSKGHARIDSASIVPTNDATVLFTTAGMHPLVPYLLGQKHPAGSRLVDVQRCVRTNDIDEVGDMGHCTFFEMLGNWSLGDYFKQEAIEYSFEFLTSAQYLGFALDRLAVTVFAGEGNIPRDDESYQKWLSLGVKKENIFFLGKEDNWWGLGAGTGPCGPDTEMFIDTGKAKCCDECSPACKCGKYLEIWNDVFMQYYIDVAGNAPQLLDQKNVDTGMGVERVLCMKNGLSSVYETEIFRPAILALERMSGKAYIADSANGRYFRIISEHIRSVTMMIGDENETLPSNVHRGYVLRRLIRRAVNCASMVGVAADALSELIQYYIEYYKSDYHTLDVKRQRIIQVYLDEVAKFDKTLLSGKKELEKVISGIERKKAFVDSGEVVENVINGKTAFRLFDTFGFPIELTTELAAERGYAVDRAGFDLSLGAHQELSRTSNAGAFKGGLADGGVETVRLHTAAHIMLAALQKLIDKSISQKGSNITSERLRFDFNLDRKLTDEEVESVEAFVNDAIAQDLEMVCREMPLTQAKQMGANGAFESKYSEMVKVYTLGNISCEICGGPHVAHSGEMGRFKISKQEAVSAGVRRIKAVLV